jgi:hypothetical protein
MIKSISNQILIKIKKAGRGSLFFSESFTMKGNADAVRKALERLVKKGEIERVANGIYVRPEIDPVIGKVSPGIDAVVRAIAKRDKARIVPTGIYALNKLGLSTQVPMNVVYLTDGASRKIKVAGRIVKFKKVSPKNVAAIGAISCLAIQALRAIGKDKVTGKEIKQIQTMLKKEKPTHLEHDFHLAPAWIREIIRPALKQIAHE